MRSRTVWVAAIALSLFASAPFLGAGKLLAAGALLMVAALWAGAELGERAGEVRSRERARGLLDLAVALGSAREASAVGDLAVRVGGPLVGADLSALLVESAPGRFAVAASAGGEGTGTVVAIDLDRHVLDIEDAIRRRDVLRDERSGAPSTSRLLAPLLYGRETLGVLLLESRRTPEWDDEGLEAVRRLSALVALSLKNARLFEALSSPEESDVTGVAEAEHHLRHRQRLELAGTLAGGMAHDLNNVLGGIVGYASLLRGVVEEDETASRYVDTIERSALAAARLTGRLLSAARGRPACREAVSLNLVVEETLELLAHSVAPRVRIERSLDAGLPAMLADPSQLQQIVLNLCVNARDAMTAGGLLRVTTRYEPSEDRARLTVEDDGVGMDTATLRRLFEPYFSTKGEGGTGLGLSVVSDLVKAMGGEIRVRSAPGKGARFDVLLPGQWATTPPALRDGALHEASEPGSRGEGELVLIADDERVIRELGRETLEGAGYRAETVASGEEVLEFVRSSPEPVALVILDLVMPGIDGEETLRRLRRDHPGMPVLLSSGLAEECVSALAGDLASGFLGKPYGMGELTRAVAAALGNRRLVH